LSVGVFNNQKIIINQYIEGNLTIGTTNKTITDLTSSVFGVM